MTGRSDTAAARERRRAAALGALIGDVPYLRFLGIDFDRRGDELTGILAFDEMLIGNPVLPALHGGATAAFLEVTAIVTLSWTLVGDDPPTAGDPAAAPPMRLPRTIDFSVDYLRPGQPRDAYARARVNRSGRRYASVHVEGWQDSRDRLFAQGTGHFLMPDHDG